MVPGNLMPCLDQRPGSQDQAVVREVMHRNCYHLPARFSPSNIIVDIGAHIGTFAVACAMRGAGKVVCYEPDKDNFALLERNTRRFPNVQNRNVAVWRSDRQDALLFSGYPEGKNACGVVLHGCTWRSRQSPIASVGLDEAILHATEKGTKRIRLLKIDAEGAEYAMIFTSLLLRQADEIIGEVHEMGDLTTESVMNAVDGCKSYDAQALKKELEGNGFEVRLEKANLDGDKYPVCFNFFAKRKETLP